jgi:hypothetical protein
MGWYVNALVTGLMLLLMVGAWRLRRRRTTPGAGAVGMMHELLNQEQRAAIEIIVEGRAAEHDPEDRDGNLPELANPKRIK